MPGPDPAVAATRVAVRRVLAEQLSADPAGGYAAGSAGEGTTPAAVLVACSGGTDSLALAAATAFEAGRLGVDAGAIIVDHGLQDGSGEVAARAARACLDLGLHPVLVRRVSVAATGAGPEAAARQARYAALEEAAATVGADLVLLGHTRDDQAEQVLLGLARGSGARSLAGMPPRRGVFARPFLDLPRSVTAAACRAQRLTPWADPHNDDERYARVRARRVLRTAESVLGPGVAAALARSAGLLAADADALDEWAAREVSDLGPGPWPVDRLAGLPPAVRGRVWRRLAAAAGCPAGDVAAVHVGELDRLISAWRGQGPVSLPAGLHGERRDGRVRIGPPADPQVPPASG